MYSSLGKPLSWNQIEQKGAMCEQAEKWRDGKDHLGQSDNILVMWKWIPDAEARVVAAQSLKHHRSYALSSRCFPVQSPSPYKHKKETSLKGRALLSYGAFSLSRLHNTILSFYIVCFEVSYWVADRDPINFRERNSIFTARKEILGASWPGPAGCSSVIDRVLRGPWDQTVKRTEHGEEWNREVLHKL